MGCFIQWAGDVLVHCRWLLGGSFSCMLLTALAFVCVQKEGRMTQSGKLCATPFGVDVVGITELIALTGALVGGGSAWSPLGRTCSAAWLFFEGCHA